MEGASCPSNQASQSKDGYVNGKQRKKAKVGSKRKIKNPHQRVSEMVFYNPPRKVVIGKYLEKITSGYSLIGAIDSADGEFLSIAKWVIKYRNLTLEDIKRKIIELQKEFLRLLPLKHPNLIHLLNWKCKIFKNCIVINLLMEYSGGINLSIYTDGNKPLSLEMVRAYTKEILQALQYLHQNSVFHTDLKPSNIIVDSNGNIRLRGYSLERRINDLHLALTKQDRGSLPMLQDKQAPNGNIYQLGQLLWAFSNNKNFNKFSLEIPTVIPEAMQDFLTQCLQQDKELQQTASQLLEHSFLKETVPLTPDLNEQLQKKTLIPDLEIPNENFATQDKTRQRNSSGVSNSQSIFETAYMDRNKIGSGAFGEVFKVQHILDGQCYAVKRIFLDPERKDLNTKIMREVKLLSRLKHEHVVRYFDSWIEYTNEQITPENRSSAWSPSGSESEKLSERSAQVVKSIPATSTLSNTCSYFKDEVDKWITGDDDWVDEEDLEKIEKTDRRSMAQSNYSTDPNYSMGETSGSSHQDGEDNLGQILYIKMECCDKRTMKTIIDEGLYKNNEEVWRFFKEIAEGLAHIHEKNIIHRDLKPVNIFLDPFDHVKIGDFGLARNHNIMDDDQYPGSSSKQLSSSGQRSEGGNLTGRIGTCYYISPEVKNTSESFKYDQKVDLYSLGVIFFEMCYRSLPTGHERDKILTKLTNSRTLPEDFGGNERTNEVKIILWLLNHDPSMRPTSKELLSSDLLPPAKVEETEVKKILDSALRNPQSTSHCQLLKTIFDQKISEQQEVGYDHELLQDIFPWIKVHLLKQLGATLTAIFSNHGAIQIQLPLFMSVCSVFDGDETLVKVLNQKGMVVSIPRDQRVPLARYIGKKKINSIKHFAIEQSFKEENLTKVENNIHPMSITECTFDIISLPSSLIPDAEVLVVVQEIINTFQSLQDKKYYIQINHVSLLKAVLLLHGIPEDLHLQIFSLLAEANTKRKKIQALIKGKIQALLIENNIMKNETAAQIFFDHLQSEFTIEEEKLLVKIFPETGPVHSLAMRGIDNIKTIVKYATSMGLKLKVIITLSFIHNPKIYSGMVFQVTNYLSNDPSCILATGGRYDKLIESFLSPDECSNIREKPTGVGFTLLLESIASVVSEEIQVRNPSFHVAIVSYSERLVHDELALARKLWDAGVKTTILYKNENTGNDLMEFSSRFPWRQKEISTFLLLQESGNFEVISPLGDKLVSVVPAHDLISYLKQMKEKKKIISDVLMAKTWLKALSRSNSRFVQECSFAELDVHMAALKLLHG